MACPGSHPGRWGGSAVGGAVIGGGVGDGLLDNNNTNSKIVTVDLGFIVFNELTYPNLINFFKELKDDSCLLIPGKENIILDI